MSVARKRLLPGSSATTAFEYDIESIKKSEGHFSAQELMQQLIRTTRKFNLFILSDLLLRTLCFAGHAS
jgi:hypothetical protein